MHVMRMSQRWSPLVRSISNYTKLPLQEHYIQLLAKEGIQDQQAKELIAILDNQVRQQ